MKSVMCLSLLLIAISLPSWADKESDVQISPLSWSDKNELERKKNTIENLGRRYFGKSLKNNREDLELLQQIANKKIIKKEDTETLQATGVVFGNVLQQELDLEWVVYQDPRGRNRALCVKNTENCVFPLTILSRRLEAGLSVDVDGIYANTLATIQPYTPDDNAYDGIKTNPTPKPSWINNQKKRSTNIPIR